MSRYGSFWEEFLVKKKEEKSRKWRKK